MDESNNETLFVRTNKSFIENSIDDSHGNQFKQQFINNKIDLEITDIHNEDKNDDDDDAEVLDNIRSRSINQNNFIDCMEFETIPIDHDTAVVVK